MFATAFVVGRIRAACVLIHAIDVDVRTLGQEVVRTEHALVVLRAVRAVTLRVVVSCAQQQSRGQLILEVDFGVVERWP